MLILGIETSCDETGIALYDTENGLVGHDLYSQIATHAVYGGVVPELASRDHVRKLLPMVEGLLKTHQLNVADLGAIAYTAGPGLIGALLVGASFARGLAFARNIPAIGIHHMEAHLLAPMLEDPRPEFPFVALLVSGGHTMLVEVDGIGQYKLLGESLDDAAGEAFDKTAKLLGLGYPGGPALAALAEKGKPGSFEFTRPMVSRPGLDFSFSGLKTQVVHTLQKIESTEQSRADLAHAFQEAVVDTLAIKCDRALKITGHSRLVVAGGVSANVRLREALQAKLGAKAQIFYPQLAFCTDNGAMIALTGALRWNAGLVDAFIDYDVRPRWPLMEL